MRTTLLTAAIACTLFLGSAKAQDAFYSEASEAQLQQVEQTRAGSQPADDLLQPGEYQWFESEPREGAITVVVSLQTQRASVYRDAELIALSTVSTGKPGNDTPTGVYTILQKKKMHRSNLYDDAPMPFMQRLTWDGVALHAGRIPGHPASHGCVRLPKEFAQRLYGITQNGQTVVISDNGSIEALARVGLPQYLAAVIGTQDLPADAGVDDVLPALADDERGEGGESLGVPVTGVLATQPH